MGDEPLPSFPGAGALIYGFLRKTLGLSEKLLNSVLDGKDDDWTSVIRLHAMIETSLNHVLLARFKDPELAEVIGRLETGDTKRGKIAFAKKFKWITKKQMTFIQQFSTLRNYLVHDARNFEFSLENYPEKLDRINEGDGDAWIKAIAVGLSDQTFIKGAPVTRMEFARKRPMLALRETCFSVFLQMFSAHAEIERKQAGGESNPTGSPCILPPALPL